MKWKISTFLKGFSIIGCVTCLLACGPVHRFTRVKNIPREYQVNYCVEGAKAPWRNPWFKSNPWIVFADHNGRTYMSPTGKNELLNVSYMDAFLVIGRKGDWLKLVKYDPEILKNRRLKEWKKAKYYGWINQNDLLLTKGSITDVSTGLRNKQVVMLTDTLALGHPDKYFVGDSVKLFKDKDLTQMIGKIPYYAIVYPYKKTDNGKHTLVANGWSLNADSLPHYAIGWINNELLVSIGQQLHVDVTTLPDSVFRFKDKKNKDLRFTRRNIQQWNDFAQAYNPVKYNPVLSYRRNDTLTCFKTSFSVPVIDKSDSYVLNVNGRPIHYSQFNGKIEKDLRKINVVFVMEGKEETIKRFPSVVNVIQGLQSQLANDGAFSFRVGAVLTFNEANNSEEPICKLTSNYMEMLDFLSKKSENADQLKPTYGIHGSWSGLRIGVELFNKCPDETNALVVVGDKGYNSEWADSTLVKNLVKNNCRLLGFQLYGGSPDNFNNFVLQIGNMIDCYAPRISMKKRELIVYANQIRSENEYAEINHNTYCLDFPNRSMTQGWLIFPQKSESLEMEGLSTAIDSMLIQVKIDNTLLINNLNKAFDEVGMLRYKLDSTLVDYGHIRSLGVQPILSAFPGIAPAWRLPALPIMLPNIQSSGLGYYLLANEEEFERLRKYVGSPAKLMVDYKFKAGKKKKSKTVNPCNCPDDFMVDKGESAIELIKDSMNVAEYASTRKVRCQIVHHYLSQRNTDKYCKISRKAFLGLPISEAQRRFTSSPVDNAFLEGYRVKDIKKKKIISDEEIDLLLKYFKKKKDELDKASGQSFQSNGKTYYWISRDMLP